MKVEIANDFKNLLPPLSEDEKAQLKENILKDKKHTVLPPIVLWRETPKRHVIIDGHNQYDLRIKNACHCKYVTLDFASRFDAMDYAINVQLGRRNLSESQRALVVAQSHQRRPQGRPPGKGANLHLFQNEQNEPENKGGSENGAVLPVAELADKADVSERTMKDAIKVSEKGSAALNRAVRDDKVSISDAAAVASKPKAEQDAALEKFLDGKAPTVRAAAAKRKKKAKDDAEPKREFGDGESLEDVQADLEECRRQLGAVAALIKKVMRIEHDGRETKSLRPFCSQFSGFDVHSPILAVRQTIKNDFPVGGTPKKPVTFAETTVRKAAK